MSFVPIESRPQLYRCYIVWNASILVIILPVLLFIADIGTPTHHPQPRGTLNAISGASFRDRDRGNLYPDAHRAECRLQPHARANHKLVLRLHSRLEYCLHRCVLFCICRMGGTIFDIYSLRLALASSGLIALRIWRTQRQTRDAKMGTNLMQVSIVVIESGVFHISLSSRYDARQSHTCIIANRCDLPKRISVCSGNLHYQLAYLQYLFGHGEALSCHFFP
jgi:hypothetical protein